MVKILLIPTHLSLLIPNRAQVPLPQLYHLLLYILSPFSSFIFTRHILSISISKLYSTQPPQLEGAVQRWEKRWDETWQIFSLVKCCWDNFEELELKVGDWDERLVRRRRGLYLEFLIFFSCVFLCDTKWSKHIFFFYFSTFYQHILNHHFPNLLVTLQFCAFQNGPPLFPYFPHSSLPTKHIVIPQLFVIQTLNWKCCCECFAIDKEECW